MNSVRSAAKEASMKPTTGIADCCARAASGHAAVAPPSAASNSRRPRVTVIRPSRARCVKGTIPRHECAVLPFKEGRILVAVVRLRGRKRKGSVFRFAPKRSCTGRRWTSQKCQKRAFAGYATASESLPLISPRQQWHLHQQLRLWAAQVTHVECFQRSAKAFKGEFACKFYIRQCLDSAEHINIDQNLSILSLIAKSGGEIRHIARN